MGWAEPKFKISLVVCKVLTLRKLVYFFSPQYLPQRFAGGLNEKQ